MKPITASTLRALGACADQVDLFKHLYPDGVRRITAPMVARAMREDLQVEWFLMQVSAPLWAEYCRQCAPLLAEYYRQCAPLLAEYDRQCAPLLAEHKRQRASLGAEYQCQRASLLAEYYRQRAPLLAPCIRRALRETK